MSLEMLKTLPNNLWSKKKSFEKRIVGKWVEPGRLARGQLEQSRKKMMVAWVKMAMNERKKSGYIWIYWGSKIDKREENALWFSLSFPMEAWSLFTPALYFWFSMPVFSGIAVMPREIRSCGMGWGRSTLWFLENGLCPQLGWDIEGGLDLSPPSALPNAALHRPAHLLCISESGKSKCVWLRNTSYTHFHCASLETGAKLAA